MNLVSKNFWGLLHPSKRLLLLTGENYCANDMIMRIAIQSVFLLL